MRILIVSFLCLILTVPAISQSKFDHSNELKLVIFGLDDQNKIDKSKMLQMKALGVNTEDARIQSFTLVAIGDDFRTLKLRSDSNAFTSEMKQVMADCQESERLTLKKIKVTVDEKVYYLPPLTFYLKE